MLAAVTWALSPAIRRIRHDWTAARRADHQQELISLLVKAASAGDTGVVLRLLDAGADPNGELGHDTWCNCPLAAAIRSRQIGNVHLLLQRGADPHPGRGLDSLLALAAGQGDAGILELLLKHGAGPGLSQLNEPLVSAAGGNWPAGVRKLLKQGADPNASGPYGSSLVDAARSWGTGALRALLAAGADPNRMDSSNGMPLRQAVLAEKTEAVRILLAAGADASDIERLGSTPLQDAQEQRTRYIQRAAEHREHSEEAAQRARNLQRIIALLEAAQARKRSTPPLSQSAVLHSPPAWTLAVTSPFAIGTPEYQTSALHLGAHAAGKVLVLLDTADAGSPGGVTTRTVAVALNTGRKLWSRDSRAIGATLADDECAYLQTNDNLLTAVDWQTGTPRWSVRPPISQLRMVGGRIVGSDEGFVAGLDAATGREVWRTPKDAFYLAGSGGDTVYLKNDPSSDQQRGERLAEVDARTGRTKHEIAIRAGDANWGELVALRGSTDYHTFFGVGGVKNRYTLFAARRDTSTRWAYGNARRGAGGVEDRDLVLLPGPRGELVTLAWEFGPGASRAGLVGFDPATGRRLWLRQPRDEEPHAIGMSYAGLAGIWGGTVICSGRERGRVPGTVSTTVWGLTPRTGAQRWQIDLSVTDLQGLGEWLLLAIQGVDGKPGMVKAYRVPAVPAIAPPRLVGSSRSSGSPARNGTGRRGPTPRAVAETVPGGLT